MRKTTALALSGLVLIGAFTVSPKPAPDVSNVDVVHTCKSTDGGESCPKPFESPVPSDAILSYETMTGSPITYDEYSASYLRTVTVEPTDLPPTNVSIPSVNNPDVWYVFDVRITQTA